MGSFITWSIIITIWFFKMNTKLLQKIPLFTEQLKNVLEGKCSWCGNKIKGNEFKDVLSLKEWTISSMCQHCQDKTFK